VDGRSDGLMEEWVIPFSDSSRKSISNSRHLMIMTTMMIRGIVGMEFNSFYGVNLDAFPT
jgi:hypothetical protein